MTVDDTRPTGVILVTMGDAPSLWGVFPFLVRLFSDPAIIRAPWFVRYPLSVYISLKKLPTMLKRYRAIGGGSPMNAMTERQASALEDRLNEDASFRVFVANRYCSPDTKDAYKAAKRAGIKRLVVLPLYPHFSTATTGSSFDALKALIAKDPGPPEVSWIESYASDEAFVTAFSEKISEALNEFPEDERKDVQLLFSAHSLPHEFVAKGDPYLDEIRKTLTGVIKLLKPAYFHLCFQSKGGGKREWLKPETDEILRKLAEKGRGKVVLVPISFVAENIETLYDVEVMYREMAGKLGIDRFVRSRCLDDAPGYIDALAGIVRSSL
jgi:protoporphyrin/coproporphyrin ferrochelatase